MTSDMDILTLIGRDSRLKRVAATNGGEYAGPCPFCGGRDRFRVWPEQGRYWCRGCKKTGDAIQYLRDKENLSFAEACRLLDITKELKAHSPRPTPVQPKRAEAPSRAWQDRARSFASYCQGQLWGERGQAVRDYLHSRGLNDDTIRQWHLGFSDSDLFDKANRWGFDGHPLWVPVGVVIPCFVDGAMWYVKVRRPLLGDALAEKVGVGRKVGDGSSEPKYVQIRGSKAALFGSDTLAGQEIAFIVEGEFDTMLLLQETQGKIGVATMGGAANSLSIEWLWRFAGSKRVFVSFDVDKAGEHGAAMLAGLSARVRIVKPIGAKDLSDMHTGGGSLTAWVDWIFLKYSVAVKQPSSEIPESERLAMRDALIQRPEYPSRPCPV